jgi:regulator of replication initiation timing
MSKETKRRMDPLKGFDAVLKPEQSDVLMANIHELLCRIIDAQDRIVDLYEENHALRAANTHLTVANKMMEMGFGVPKPATAKAAE